MCMHSALHVLGAGHCFARRHLNSMNRMDVFVLTATHMKFASAYFLHVRFNDASYYYWLLAKSTQETIQRISEGTSYVGSKLSSYTYIASS